MKRHLYIILLISYFSISCIKDDSNNPACMGKLNLIYDWSFGRSLLEYDSLAVIAQNSDVSYMKTDNVGTSLALNPGNYTAIAYEPSQAIRVNGTTLTLGVGTDGYVVEPGQMSAGLTTFSVGENDSQQHILPMYYQTRELIVQVNVTGLGSNMLTSIDGLLNGVAVSRSLANGFPPMDGLAHHQAITGGKVAYDLIANPQSSATKQFYARRRLMGLDGGVAQTLLLTFHFTRGYRDASIDVTSALDTFHTVNVFEPFMIVINIFIHEDFSADIVDWQAGSKSEIEAI